MYSIIIILLPLLYWLYLKSMVNISYIFCKFVLTYWNCLEWRDHWHIFKIIIWKTGWKVYFSLVDQQSLTWWCNDINISLNWGLFHLKSKRYNAKTTFSILNIGYKVLCFSESLMVAHFWWATRAIHSFLVSDLSNFLTSLIKEEGMSELLFFINIKMFIKHAKRWF